jgi:hypothetical protein
VMVTNLPSYVEDPDNKTDAGTRAHRRPRIQTENADCRGGKLVRKVLAIPFAAQSSRDQVVSAGTSLSSWVSHKVAGALGEGPGR